MRSGPVPRARPPANQSEAAHREGAGEKESATHAVGSGGSGVVRTVAPHLKEFDVEQLDERRYAAVEPNVTLRVGVVAAEGEHDTRRLHLHVLGRRGQPAVESGEDVRLHRHRLLAGAAVAAEHRDGGEQLDSLGRRHTRLDGGDERVCDVLEVVGVAARDGREGARGVEGGGLGGGVVGEQGPQGALHRIRTCE